MSQPAWVEPAQRLVKLARPPQRPPDRCVAETVNGLFASGKVGIAVHTALRHRQAEDRIRALAEALLDNRVDFREFAYAPDAVVAAAAHKGVYPWATLVELYEAWWRLACDGRLPSAGTVAHRVATGYLARTRWGLLAVPFVAEPVARPDDWERVTDTTGESAARWLAYLARQARSDWLGVLDQIEDLPLLASQVDAEREATELTLIRLDPNRLTNEPASPLDPDDAEVWRHCVRHHLLPRFGVAAAWRVTGQLTRTWSWLRWLPVGLFTVAVVLLIVALFGWPYGVTPSNIATGLGYAAIAVAATRERASSWPWLLRQPASAAIGLLALTTLNPDWWQTQPDTRWSDTRNAAVASVVLALGAAGYLLLEATNHGVRGGALATRVTAVAGIGLAHAALVSAVALTWVVPALAEDGAGVSAWATGSPDVLPGWLVLTVAMTWSFAAGVVTQILWDDQPLTAPLAHVTWRTGR
ncbi:MAG TPA: hypothetical protein VFZ32_16805 [Micromonosporaceae bacterium]